MLVFNNEDNYSHATDSMCFVLIDTDVQQQTYSRDVLDFFVQEMHFSSAYQGSVFPTVPLL